MDEQGDKVSGRVKQAAGALTGDAGFEDAVDKAAIGT